jgi:hypothetical protein
MKGGFKFEVQSSFYASSRKQKKIMRKFDLCTDRKLKALFSAVFPDFLVIFLSCFAF